MQRRDFLRLGGATCAGLALDSAMPVRELLRDLLRGPSASVRYAEDWDGVFVDAARFPHGDPELARTGVRLTILGLSAGQTDWPGRAALDVFFPQHGWQAPFHAWSHDGGANGGSARENSFVVPVDDAGRLQLEPRWNELAFPVALMAGSEPGLPKLMSGVYLFSAAGAPPLLAAIDSAQTAPRSLSRRRHQNG